MHKVLDEDTIKPEILPQIVCGKTCLCFRRRLGGSCSMRSLQVESLAVNDRLLLLFHDVVLVGREQHPPTTVRAGRCKPTCFLCRWPLVRVYGIILFV